MFYSAIDSREQVRANAELERRRKIASGEHNRAITAARDMTFSDWAQAFFTIPETGEAIELYTLQIAAIDEATRRDDDGRFVYSTVVYSDIKKSAKTSIAAARAAYVALSGGWATVRIVANDLKQAYSRVFNYIERAISLNNDLAECVAHKEKYKITFVNKSTVEAVPIDPDGEAGGGDDLVIFTELWAARSTASRRMWTEMTLSPLKAGQSQRWVETYAGFRGESPLLEMLYDATVTHGRRIDDDKPFYTNSTGSVFCYWNSEPHLPWQTPDYYATQADELTHEEFQRIHKNNWSSASAKFIPAAWWDACRDEYLIDESHALTLALDAAVSGDCFGLVACHNMGGHSHVHHAQKWDPDGDKIDFLGTVEDPGPERVVVKMCAKRQVDEVRYDPYQLHDMAMRLASGVWIDEEGEIVDGEIYEVPVLDDNGAPVLDEDGQSMTEEKRAQRLRVNMVEFKQGTPRLVADKQLHDKIRDRKIHHKDDPDLTSHVLNANRKNDGERLRIIKRAQHLKIDLAVALSMASYNEEEQTSQGVFF